MKKKNMRIEHIPNVIAVCCILHNMCELHGESFNETWLLQDEVDYPQPTSPSTPSFSTQAPQHIRNAFAQYLYSLHDSS